MSKTDYFSGTWINGHGDTMFLRRILGRRFWVVFRIVSVENRFRHRWKIAKRDEDRMLTCYGLSHFGETYTLSAQPDATLELDVTPEMGEYVAVVNWIRWDTEGRTFRRCPTTRETESE